jgi:branched-chain amino acid transport system substrate-binding protein
MSILSGPFAVPGGDNGFKLAVSEINSSGGILGRQIQYKEFNTDITPQGATTATALALEYHPDLVVGYGVSAGLAASASSLNSAGVLVIHNTLDSITSPKALGSNLYYRLSLTDPQFASGADSYLFQQRGVKKMYIIHTSDAAPTDGAALIEADAKANGVATQTASVAPTATDLTAQILAAKNFGAQAIWEWGYPTTDGLLIKQAAANGFTGDIMTFSAGAAAKAGLIPTSLLTDKIFSVSVSCAPEVLTTPEATAYNQAFMAKYGTAPSTAVANENYDALYLYKTAATTAGSTDSKTVAAALRNVTHQGVCGEEKPDSNQNLEHSLAILSFPGAKETLAKLVTDVQSSY